MPDEKTLVLIQFDGMEIGSLKIASSELQVPENLVSNVKNLVGAVYDSGTALQNSLNEISTIQAKYDTLETELKTTKESLEKIELGRTDDIKSAVEIRLGLEKTAAFLKVDDVKKLDDVTLMQTIIKKKYGDDITLDSKSEQGRTYIQARYDIILEEVNKAGNGLDQLHQLHRLTTPREDDNKNIFTPGGVGAGEPNKSNREDFLEKSRNAFKDPQGREKKSA